MSKIRVGIFIHLSKVIRNLKYFCRSCGFYRQMTVFALGYFI